MTTALYRRYRPDTFEDVIGQEHVTDALKTALASGRVAHAFLFSGPRGCGKTTSARIMARALNCADGPTATPCGVCPSCIDLAVGGPGSLDVTEIDAASNRGVEAAAQLRERLVVAPSRDRYRIFILDEAHMVTTEGFNALLKVVEEPPEHVKFIFATTAPEKVLSTIRSRTHHYPFRLVGPEVLVPYLKRITAQENVSLEDAVYPLVVRSGGGSVRDSLSVLDQLIAGSDGHVTAKRAIELLGYTDTVLLDRAIDALGAGDGAGVFQIVEEVVGSGQEPRRFVEDLLQRLRDLMVCALAGERAADILDEIPEDQLLVMHQQAAKWGPPLLSRRADVVESALREMQGATSPRLQLELLMARLLVTHPSVVSQPYADTATPAAEQRTPKISPASEKAAVPPVTQVTVPQNLPGGVPERSGRADQKDQVSQPAELVSPPARVLGVPSANEVRSVWTALLPRLGAFGAMLPALMKATRRVEPVGEHVYFFLVEPSSVERFKNSGGEAHLSRVLTELLRRPVSARVAQLGDSDAIVAGSLVETRAETDGLTVASDPAPIHSPDTDGKDAGSSFRPTPMPADPAASEPSHAQEKMRDVVLPSDPPGYSAPTDDYIEAPPEPEFRGVESAAETVPSEPAEMDHVQPDSNAPSPDTHRGKPAADIVLDILGGTVMSEKIIGAESADVDVVASVDADPYASDELDLEVHE